MKKTSILGLVGFSALLFGAFAAISQNNKPLEIVKADEPISVHVTEDTLLPYQQNNTEGRGFYFLLPFNDIETRGWDWDTRFEKNVTVIPTEGESRVINNASIMKYGDPTEGDAWRLYQKYWIQFCDADKMTDDNPNWVRVGEKVELGGTFTNSLGETLVFDDITLERRANGYFASDVTVNIDKDAIENISYTSGGDSYRSIFFELKEDTDDIKVNKEWGSTHNFGYDFKDARYIPVDGEEVTTFIPLIKEYKNESQPELGARYRMLFSNILKHDNVDNNLLFKTGDQLVLNGTTHHYYLKDVTISYDLVITFTSDSTVTIEDGVQFLDADYSNVPYTIHRFSSSQVIYFSFDHYLEDDKITAALPGEGWTFLYGGATDFKITSKDGTVTTMRSTIAKVEGSQGEHNYVASFEDWAVITSGHEGFTFKQGDKFEIDLHLATTSGAYVSRVFFKTTIYCGSLSESNPWVLASEMEQVLETIDLIDEIGTVSRTDECLAKITAARTAYDALNNVQKTLVSNYDTLVAAENEYAHIDVEFLDADYSNVPYTIHRFSNSQLIYFSFDHYLEDDKITAVAPGENWVFLYGSATDFKITSKDGTVTTMRSTIAKVEGSQGEHNYVVSFQDWAVSTSGHDGFTFKQGDKFEVDLHLEVDFGAYISRVFFKTTIYCGSLSESNPWVLASEMEPVLETIDLIDEIGTVSHTDECLAKITAARAAYDALNTTQKTLVSNYDTLVAAENEYAQIGVEELIDAIGEVTLEKEKAINAARAAYDALTEAQKESFDETKLQTLVAAEEELALLKLKAQAAEVVALINAIGTVTSDSGRDIAAAQAAYEALPTAAREYVTNYNVLVAAQAAYKDARDQAKADEVVELIDSIGEVDGTRASLNRIKDAQDAYDDLTDAQAAKIPEEKLEILENAQIAFKAALDVAKSSAKQKVDNYYTTLDLSKYSEENKELIESKTQEVKGAIDEEVATDNLEKLVADYKAEIEAIEKLPEPTPSEPTGSDTKKACGGNIITTSIILSSVALIGVALLMLKKRHF